MIDEDEIERRLQNWARWLAGGHPDGKRTTYEPGRIVRSNYQARGYRQAIVPLLVLDAQETAAAVACLPPEPFVAIHAWYRRRLPNGIWLDASWSQIEIAACLHCSRTTFWRRVVAGREGVAAALALRRRRGK